MQRIESREEVPEDIQRSTGKRRAALVLSLVKGVGYALSLRARAKEAERALENACLARFGTLRPTGETPVVRSDNGLIFQSRRFRAACRDYRLRQEFIIRGRIARSAAAAGHRTESHVKWISVRR